ncbi:hypothetical protein ACFYTQ_37525 [Nocardia sp. NPDC004068]|uniref:hypothetical protein n=1 Tax=Nocardia sp. NPDC004068 TaxID=3364303 RepID=UPI00368846AB
MPKRSPAIWPGIGRSIAHADLALHLFRAASLHGQRALASSHDDELELLDCAMSIGISIELLAKCALATISPVLLADRYIKSAALFSGFSGVRVNEGKSRSVDDCMKLLKELHDIRYEQGRDGVVFDVRNAATHMGLVDKTVLDEALNKMVELAEQLLTVTIHENGALDRVSYWGPAHIVQVDERLKQQRRERRIRFEQLKAAARRELERLRKRLNDDALAELAEKVPDSYDDYSDYAVDDRFRRATCPVCGFEGWIEYEIARSRIMTDGDEYDGDVFRFVELTAEPRQFLCRVCSLRLDEDLLWEANMGAAIDLDPVEPTQEEVEAEEEYLIDKYLEDLEERRRFMNEGEDEI